MRLTLPRLPRRGLAERFRWRIPERFNLAQSLAAAARDFLERPALIEPEGRRVTFRQADELAARLAGWLASELPPGERVGVFLGQRLETALVHFAIYRAGLVAVPIAPVLGAEAIRYRLAHSGARLLVAEPEALEARPGAIPEGVKVVPVGGLLDRAQAARPIPIVSTAADDPAILLYTSGTTGRPKGALLPHRVLFGHLPGFYLFPNHPPPGAPKVYWSPAEWAWAGGLLDVLLPAWHYGFTVIAHRRPRFDPEEALWLLERFGVTHTFLFPTALKRMRALGRLKRPLRLESVHAGGEPLAEALIEWSRENLGQSVNEFYGQTEANLLVGQSHPVDPLKPGSMGLAYPGHRVEVIDDEGHPLPPGEVGEVALRTPDPVAFLGYFRDEERTRAKFRGPWLVTGDLAYRDEDGYFWFTARKDDLIKTAGYRIGPAEIEAAILSHPGVEQVAVIGVPDPERGQRTVAFVVGEPGIEEELKSRVRTQVGAHAVPREIRYLDALPTTVTGKVQRHRLKALWQSGPLNGEGPPR